MSLFAQLLKKPCAAPARPAVPDFMIPESQNHSAALPAVAAPESPAEEIVCSRKNMIPESQNGAAIRKSVIPESSDFRLRKKPADHSPEERALRDQKLEFIRAVWELRVSEGFTEKRACELIAEKRAEDFPLLMTAGKNGTSAMRYNNYRNWINGTGKGSKRKPGLGRLNDGSPDYRNADVLLRNYALAGTKELYGDPMFWAALRGLWLRNSNPYLAKNYRHLRWIWESDYPDQILPSLSQVRDRFKKDFPLRMRLLARRGENFYDQNIRDYIERDADSIRPGEAWVADTKDCDFQIRVPAPEGYTKSDWMPIRPKLVVIMDVKSQFPVSVQLIAGNCNNAVIRNGFAAAVGLGDVPAWLRPFRVLSVGERFRAGIARVIAEPPEKIVIDEFTSALDRQIARFGALAFAKAWRRLPGPHQCLILTCHRDVIDWLQPDWMFDTATGKFSAVGVQRPRFQLEIYRTNWRFWPIFEPHHYLTLPRMICSKCYIGVVDGEPVCHVAMSSRNKGKEVEARGCRLVVLPEWQGAGIGLRFLNAICDMNLRGDEGGRFPGRPVTTVFHTSHPGLSAALRRDRRWRCVSAHLYGQNRCRNSLSMKRSSERKTEGVIVAGNAAFGGHFRAIQGFRYVGEEGLL